MSKRPIENIEPMNFSVTPTLGSDRDTLPLKKRDQRWCSSKQLTEGMTFKVPYPYKSPNRWKTGPVQPIPRRVPALYQPWALTHTSTKAKHHFLSHIQEQCSWVERQESTPLYPGWEHPDLQAGPLPRPFDLRDAGYGWEVPTLQQRFSLNTRWQANGNNRYPYIRKTDRPIDHLHERVEAGSASLPPIEEPTLQKEFIYKLQTPSVYRYPQISRPGPQVLPSSKVPPSGSSEEEFTSVGTKQASPGSPSLSYSQPPSSSSSSSPEPAPWLLPHFMAGSLIELVDGRLRRVEDLRTEDFLLGSHASPDLRLSCCTVQGISPSASSSSLLRLLILLHDQLSQELVDVYVEYPFFVRGRGWSSCCPQKTAHLCGLQCRQLKVGDVCFVLTPGSPHGTYHPPKAATLGQDNSTMAEGGCCPKTRLPTELRQAPTYLTQGQKEEAEPVRKRHRSAPELGVSGGYHRNDAHQDLIS